MKSVKLDWKLMHYVERKTMYVVMCFVLKIDVASVVIGLVVVI